MKVKNCIFGTAGHIDHGKSSLVQKLTGTDPDRLKEEKERGITVDLGFAFLQNAQHHISFVDVPGHEKLVKNMIAGATGFDACLFAVDAREGIMPQTVEHANIIHTLGVQYIIVAVTKSDLLTEEELSVSITNIKAFFEQYEFLQKLFIPVSIFDENSMIALQQLIFETADQVPEKNSHLPFMLRVDRSFSVKGFGTVVTGTAISGRVKEGNQLDLLPEEKTVKVKGLNVHNQKEKEAFAGQRVAINLSGVERKDIARGHVLAQDNTLRFTDKIYAKVTLFDQVGQKFSLKNNRTYPVFIGTAHTMCKLILLGTKEIKNGESTLCVIKLDSPYAPFCGEKFLLRGMSPQMTIAGGEVLAVSDFGLKKDQLTTALILLSERKADQLVKLLLSEHINGLTLPPELQFLQADCHLESIVEEQQLKFIRQYLIAENRIGQVIDDAVSVLTEKEQFDLNGLKENFDFPPAVCSLIESRVVVKAKDMGFVQSGSLLKKNEKSDFEKLCDTVLSEMKKDVGLSNSAVIGEKFGLDDKTAANCIKHLANREQIVQIAERVWMSSSTLDLTVKKIKLHCVRHQFVDVKSLKTIIGASRKILISLMDYLDTTGDFVNREHKRYLK